MASLWQQQRLCSSSYESALLRVLMYIDYDNGVSGVPCKRSLSTWTAAFSRIATFVLFEDRTDNQYCTHIDNFREKSWTYPLKIPLMNCAFLSANVVFAFGGFLIFENNFEIRGFKVCFLFIWIIIYIQLYLFCLFIMNHPVKTHWNPSFWKS